MQIIETTIPDVILLKPRVFADERGFFLETYRQQFYEELGIANFVQDNHSHSKQGVLRGLHYQHQFPQGKLVSVIQGSVFDVAVDLRQNSKTFGQWVGFTLDASDPQFLYIPPGFAHGFCVLSESADFIYKCTEYYHPQSDAGIIWNDEDINIEWPIENPSLSEKDAILPKFKNIDKEFLF